MRADVGRGAGVDMGRTGADGPGPDALYLNFISGFELELGTARALRQAFHGPIYADVHSLLFGMPQDGVRVLRPLADPAGWFGCFDVVQMNEDEMRQFGPDPLTVAAQALDAGVSLLVVTLGSRGTAYVAAPGFEALRLGGNGARGAGRAVTTDRESSPAVRTSLIPAPVVDAVDPTGCGDVFGAALCSELISGATPERAIREANRLAARNAELRGAGALGALLRGQLARPAGATA